MVLVVKGLTYIYDYANIIIKGKENKMTTSKVVRRNTPEFFQFVRLRDTVANVIEELLSDSKACTVESVHNLLDEWLTQEWETSKDLPKSDRENRRLGQYANWTDPRMGHDGPWSPPRSEVAGAMRSACGRNAGWEYIAGATKSDGSIRKL